MPLFHHVPVNHAMVSSDNAAGGRGGMACPFEGQEDVPLVGRFGTTSANEAEAVISLPKRLKIRALCEAIMSEESRRIHSLRR